MKNPFQFPITILYLIVLVSCSNDSPFDLRKAQQPNPHIPGNDNDDNGENNESGPSNVYFGFLDGLDVSDTLIDRPIESSTTNLFIGRWKIIKGGVDHYNNGDIKYINYQDTELLNCGLSFLQFNNDGIVIENVYQQNKNVCVLYTKTDKWELIDTKRFKIDIYDFIFLVKVTDSELILKYDWNYTHWGPMQTYYYYKRIQPKD